jgi:hypothetical protein
MNTLIIGRPFLRVGFLLIALASIALLHNAQAVVPPPDGGYPGFNTAEGQNALLSLNTSAGLANTAVGWFSLKSNVDGGFNTALGAGTLVLNTAAENTAIGAAALLLNSTGFNNTAVGVTALLNNTTGFENTATGDRALPNNTSGSDNIGLGANAGSFVTTASNVIVIGANFQGANEDNSTYVNNIWLTAVNANGVPVLVDDTGKLGQVASAQRFKRDIQPMEKASEAILALKPVKFHYKSDVKNTPCFGLVAEDVEKVNPHLVVRDKNGKLFSVRYEQINAMLLNEFLKEHRKVEKLDATIVSLTATVKEQAAQIQRVNAQLELRKPAPQTVAKNR